MSPGCIHTDNVLYGAGESYHQPKPVPVTKLDTCMLPPPGSHPFLPALLAHVHAALPGFPLEPVLVQLLLLSIISGDRNLILRTRDEDVSLVSKLATLALNTLFGYSTHRLRCHSSTANQTPSELIRALFFAGASIGLPPDDNPPGSSAKHASRRVSNSRDSAGKSPIAPSTSVSTARSRRTSLSHPVQVKPSVTTPGRHHSDSDDLDRHPSASGEVRPGLQPTSTETDVSIPTLASSIKTHHRNISRGSTDPSRFPSVVVVSGLELASLASQKAVLRTLAERKIVVSDAGIYGHDQDGLTMELPDGFFMVYVCRSDPRERPPIYKSLLDMFAMSSSVDVGAQTRLAMRQFRPPSSPSTTFSSPHASFTSAAFPAVQSPSSVSGPPTPPQPLTSPVISSALLQQLKSICTTQVRIRLPLNIYLSDLFSATRHYGPLDGMMLTVRARQDAEALVRASRVLGTDHTGAELIRQRAEQSHENGSISTYPHSHLSTASNTSSDGLIDGSEVLEMQTSSEQGNLDVSEADIARIFPRVVSHRIRVRDSPFDEVLCSAVCGAVGAPGNGPHEEAISVQWERETVKDILVHILAEV